MHRIKRPRGFEKQVNPCGVKIAWVAFYEVPYNQAHAAVMPDGRSTTDDTFWLGDIFVTHGSEGGIVQELQQAKAANLVICCYPVQVQRRNPSLRVLGNWMVITRVVVITRNRRGEEIRPYLAVGYEI
jgi:hypothetical protein